MQEDLITADYRRFIENGIQTGEALNFIGLLSPLQRQLLEASEFYFANGVLLKKKDETIEPLIGADKLQSDDKERREFASQILDRLEATGERISHKIWSGDNSTLGLYIEWNNKLEKEQQKETCLREAKNRKEEAISEITRCVKDKQTKERLTHSECNAYMLKLTAENRYASQSIENITNFLMQEGAYKSTDALDHLADVTENSEGMTMHFDNGTTITVDTISVNSMLGGAGYAPPRDSYKTVRLLKYEDQAPEVISANQRRSDLKCMIRDIARIVSQEELQEHWYFIISTKNPNSLYSQDKKWRQKWGNHQREKLAIKIANELTTTRLPQTIIHKDVIYEIELNNEKYQARVKENSEITIESWYKISSFTKVPINIGQILIKMVKNNEIIPHNNYWENKIPASDPPRPYDEETLRRRIEYRLQTEFDRERMKATTELNYTVKQWEEIFTAYECTKKALNNQTKKKEKVDATTYIQSLIENSKSLIQLQNIILGPLTQASMGNLLVETNPYILPASSMKTIKPLIQQRMEELKCVAL